MTKQRAAILQAMQESHQHLNAEEIFNRAKQILPSLALGTVYRNLNAMCEEGEIFRIPVPGQPDHYDKNPIKHEHTYCERCGSLTDLLLPELTALLAEKCPGLTGYQLTVCALCEDCRAEQETKAS